MESCLGYLSTFPEILQITKPNGPKNCLFYCEQRYNKELVIALSDFYKVYFELEPVIVFPKCIDAESGSLYILENLNIKKNSVVIFAYADILFNDLMNVSKRRLEFNLKACAKTCKTIILSMTNLKILELNVLETFQAFKLNSNFSFKNIDINWFDMDDSFAEMVSSFKDKKVYISLNLPIKDLKAIEAELIENNLQVFKREPSFSEGRTNASEGSRSVSEKEGSFVVLNSFKTHTTTFLNEQYDIYIFMFPQDIKELDPMYCFKDIPGECSEIYIESESSEFIETFMEKCFTDSIKQNNIKHLKIKDSIDSFETTKAFENAVCASDEYYRFVAPDTITSMDLKNLSRKDYDIIRNFVLTKLKCKYDLDVKTCQLGTPCSPKDRSKKLNSLSNKISSIDYRCDVTCEIFMDYSIGVVIWSEQFASKENIPIEKGEKYIYQTTYGKWKVTEIN